MSGPPERFRFRIIAKSRALAIAAGRREAYKRGWIGTHIASCVPATVDLFAHSGRPSTPTPCWDIILEVREQRGADPQIFMGDRRWKPGMAVLTRAEGVNHAGGTRHVMPPGVEGVVLSKQGINLRVRFVEVPGRSFLYSPHDLELPRWRP